MLTLLPVFSAATLSIRPEERSIDTGRATLSVPFDLVEMDQKVIDVEYPDVNRPDQVFGNKATTINVAISHTRSPASPEAADTKDYDPIFFSDVDERLLMCSPNCTVDEMEEWTPVAHGTMPSLQEE